MQDRGLCLESTHKSRPAFNVMVAGYLGLIRHSLTFRELRLVGLMWSST